MPVVHIKKIVKITACLALLLPLQMTHADEVISIQDDTTGGKVYGGYTAFMLGGAAGGPAGALVGGLVGLCIGDAVQSKTQLAGESYVVKKDDGTISHFRAKKDRFAVGEKVFIDGMYLRKVSP